jgi:hypothetical protein
MAGQLSDPVGNDHRMRTVTRKPKKRLSFEQWKVINTSGSFGRWYVYTVLNAVAGTKKTPHATLGPNLKPGSLERAADIAKLFIEFGVSKSDTVIDYGCGTLRIGQFLIEYLDPQKFIGLDIDQRIVDRGLAMLPPALVAEKQPTVDVISEEAIARIAARHPRWIYANEVLHHVPPEDLSEFFENIYRLSNTETTGVIWTIVGEETTRSSAKSWRHGKDGILDLANSIGFCAEFMPDPLTPEDIKILVLKRTDNSLGRR